MKYRKKKSYWQRDIRKYEYLLAILRGSAVLCIISYLFYGNLFYVILISPYLIWYIKSWEKQTIKNRKERFRLQFKEAILSISAALNVGYSVENAVREATKDLRNLYKKDETILRELEYVARQLQMNVSVEEALGAFATRVEDEDVQIFVTTFNMAKRSGGDSLAIIRNVVRQIGEKIDVEREIQTIISAKKLEFRIMTLIPFGMVAYLKISFPEFIDVLYGNLAGGIIMSLCLCAYAISYEAGRRMIEIEV